MSTQHIRQRIQSEFRRQQLMLDKEALALLVEYVEHAPTGIDAVYTVIDKLEAGLVHLYAFDAGDLRVTFDARCP